MMLYRCRAAGYELHHTIALMGGIIAQEACKFITHHFAPMGVESSKGAVFAWNGVRCSGTVLDV